MAIETNADVDSWKVWEVGFLAKYFVDLLVGPNFP